MNEIRNFDKQDWDCYAGAERFGKNSEPLILDLELDYNAEATVIADKNGIQVFISNSEGCDSWLKDIRLSALRAEGELRAIQKAVKELTYAPDLAYALDHPTQEVLKGFDYSGETY